ncbi:hypothetical protein [Aeromonas salmonicida]|uniref:hypothetical protein n=3 Tax=Aeromonas salmonicida TaxID=645 RepID=UPI001CEDDE50|nr:hypothetical protein [Aeromonas salmonicida]WCH38401.1 hypothetical protein ONZ57_13100 [Aeromonas salmonicida]WCH50264.1 hypothetical protein ONZ63_11775 [Aeromonas salmonicida]WGI37224.1 hypothetical protein QDU35_12195 [Aeromonas salmonicida]
MSEIIIDGQIFSSDELASLEKQQQLDILKRWFNDYHEYIPRNDHYRYQSQIHYQVDPIVELNEVFDDVVNYEVLEQVADEIEHHGAGIWVSTMDNRLYWTSDVDEADSYAIFQTSIDRIIEMKNNAHLLGGQDFQQHLFQILYANIFTSFEAYMVRAFINKLFESNDSLHQFIEKQKEFPLENPKLLDLLKGQEHIDHLIKARTGVVAQISQQIMISPAPSDRYTRGFLTGRPRVFSLFIALTYAITSPT